MGSRAAQKEKFERFKNEAGKLRRDETATVDEVRLLAFLLDEKRYAIDIARVLEIATPAPLTPIATAGPLVLGLMSLRGVVVAILDVRARLHGGEAPSRMHPPLHVIVVDDPGGPTGFEVDRVLRPLTVARDAISAGGTFGPANALTTVLDLDKLFS